MVSSLAFNKSNAVQVQLKQLFKCRDQINLG